MASFAAKDDIESRAAAWAVRVSEGGLSAAEQQQLDEWLASSPRHLGAYLQAQATWLDVDRVLSLGGTLQPDAAQSVPVAPPRRRWRLAAMAASLLVTGSAALYAYDHLAGRVAADLGEVRRIGLEDGSTLFLNSTAAVQVRFSRQERRIILRRGEASFQVAHNAARPFVVEAGEMTVTAVGTEFTVDLDHHGDGLEKGLAVTVSNGIVRVADTRADNPQLPRMLARDERLVSADTGTWRVNLPPAEIDRQLAWRSGMLVFKGQQLGAAAAEVSRYARLPVFVDDPSLARAQFIGTFRMGNTEAFAKTAAAAFNAQLTRREDGFHLDRPENSPSH